MTRAAVSLVLVGALAAACGESTAPATSELGPPPRLEFRPGKIDLGARFDDERPETTIGLANTGGRTLHIERIDANCGCIALGDAPKKIEPGKSVDLKFQIRLVGMTGKVSRNVAVRSDDPASTVSRVTIEADVRPRIETSKTLIEIRPATVDESTTVDVDVTGASGQDLAGLSCVSATKNVASALTISGKTARLRVSVEPFVDDFTTAVVLKLGAAERVLVVKGVSARDVRAEHPNVWADGPDGARIGATKLVGREGLKWSVKSVESDRKELTAEVVGDELRVKVGAGVPAGEFKGHVVLKLEGAKPDTLRVEVAAWVEQK
jgi:hypothetical protein